MYHSPEQIQRWQDERAGTTKAIEAVTFQSFDQDGNVTHEHVEHRMVYRLPNGRIEINRMGSRRPAILEDGKLVAFGSQLLPIRKPVKKWRYK